MFEVSVTGSFEASHFIDAPTAAEGYRRMHGHSYVVTVSVANASPNEDGWIVDLGKLETELKAVLATLDHGTLNDIPGLERPTFENILLWIDAEMMKRNLSPSRLEIERPTIRQRAVYVPTR